MEKLNLKVLTVYNNHNMIANRNQFIDQKIHSFTNLKFNHKNHDWLILALPYLLIVEHPLNS
jgi:hypothetical protein